MYCAAARAKNRSLIPVTTKIMAPKSKDDALFMHIFGQFYFFDRFRPKFMLPVYYYTTCFQNKKKK